jgi:hemolysin activation/secretion protein
VRQLKTSLSLAALLVGSATWAQNIPDAGALMRQTEQMLKQSQLQRLQQNRSSLPPEMVLTDATSVTVARFQFNGNKLMSTEQLQAVAEPFVNRTLTQQDLHHLMSAVTESYRQIGWLVQTYLPKQDLKGPELTIQIIESIPPNKPLR